MKMDSGKGKIAVLRTIGFSKPGALHPVPPRCFQRLGHFAPLYFSAYGGKIQATRCAVGR
jgi:glycerol-3-phosphate acyltransferase PlsY